MAPRWYALIIILHVNTRWGPIHICLIIGRDLRLFCYVTTKIPAAAGYTQRGLMLRESEKTRIDRERKKTITQKGLCQSAAFVSALLTFQVSSYCCSPLHITTSPHRGDVDLSLLYSLKNLRFSTERFRPKGLKNVHYFLTTVRHMSRACDLAADMLLILIKNYFPPGQVLDLTVQRNVTHFVWA